MKQSPNMLEAVSRGIFCSRRLLCLFLVSSMLLMLTGCSASTKKEVIMDEQSASFQLEPCRKENGSPFCIAVMDLAPPIESSYLWLKGIAEQLQKMGYIREEVDFNKAPEDFEGFYQYLTGSDLGEYVKFDEECYMVGVSDQEDARIAKKLKNKSGRGEIDVIASTGTTPGIFLKDLKLDIPVLVSFATDPVASGIIDSAEDTGNDNIWALIEPNPMSRQLEAYHTMFQIKKLGMITVEEYEEIAAVPEYEQKAEELGIEVEKESIREADLGSKDLQQIVKDKTQKLIDQGIDAFLLTLLVLDDDDPGILTDMLAREKIPYLISDGNALVEKGGMMCLSCYDYGGYGSYAAMILSNIFHGQKAGDQPCVYTSSVQIALNLTTAEKTGFDTDFEFLQSVDWIYK